jgi:glycosyltransferase involved in cell wall biosynthesis
MNDPAIESKTRLGPPGVDADAFRPKPREEAAAALARLTERLATATGAASGGARSFGADPAAATALRAIEPSRDRIVSYVGKLIVSKGVDLLVAAWPLVHRAVPDARLAVVGFGGYREPLERLANALRSGDLATARDIAARGRELEGGPPGGLKYLGAFLDRADDAYLAAAAAALERVHFTGRLEYDDLPDILCNCEAQVVPSTWPEAFGMVAAEAACCGVLPVSARHSGLEEVSAQLAEALPERLRPLLSFDVGPNAVDDIADRLVRWLTLPGDERAAARDSLSNLARERFSWEGVARNVVAAAEGRLDALPRP